MVLLPWPPYISITSSPILPVTCHSVIALAAVLLNIGGSLKICSIYLHNIIALAAHLDKRLVAGRPALHSLIRVAQAAKLVDRIIAIAGRDSLVAVLLSPDLEQPVVTEIATNNLSHITRGAVLDELILPRSYPVLAGWRRRSPWGSLEHC